ncbi:hypothetical protein [Lysinibacillus sphaericus]|uniref:Uncharacterized protein n=1 Tax=Lysinibacillus sphaericus OT4b.31 TaxID=1285586 RepID=R7Z8H3_LYSSH|nr:hypothetical protein [Lysinibacillus sphaericus]EON70470.1 hypothetical protein H131_21337 [Lysinibacillus sphaericus OT4b.31]
MKNSREKFEGLDIIQNMISSNIKYPFIITLEKQKSNYKNYQIMVIKDNEVERDNHLKKLNEIASKENHSAELANYLENNTFEGTIKEFYGTIECQLINNTIEIMIKVNDEIIKELVFGDNDYLDDYLNFLKVDLSKLVRKEIYNLK